MTVIYQNWLSVIANFVWIETDQLLIDFTLLQSVSKSDQLKFPVRCPRRKNLPSAEIPDNLRCLLLKNGTNSYN